MRMTIGAATLAVMLSIATAAAQPARPAAAQPATPAASDKPAPAQPAPQPIDLAAIPAGQWVERAVSGWKGKDYYGHEQTYAWTSAGEFGLLLLDIKRDHPGTAIVRRFDPASGVWSELATAKLEVAFKNQFNSPTDEFLHGIQLCYDSDRKTLVALSATDLDGRGRVIEFDLTANTAAGVQPELAPPVVTAASLAYDPVNKEVVLATGGFSPVGGTDGTWLYDGTKKSWRRLETPQLVDEVRLPVEQALDRLTTLRWLIWKNAEYRATGREKLLDARAASEALAAEAADLAGLVRALSQRAFANAAKAERKYHADALTSAGEALKAAAESLAGLDATIRTASPEQMEKAYRRLAELSQVGRAVHELAVAPEPRMNARLVYDPASKLIVCFGGQGQRCGYADTWVYHCQGRWWERRHPSPHPGPADSRASASLPGAGVVVGGRFIYDAPADAWKQLPTGLPKEGFWLECDPASGTLVAMNADWKKAWVMRPDAAAGRPVAAEQTREVYQTQPAGEFVLRDASTLAELKLWQAEMARWVADVPANTWVNVPTHGTGRPNWGRTWSSIVYDPGRRQILYRDGGHGSYHGADTDHYDITTGRWFRSDLRDLPPWPMGTYFAWGRAFSLAPWAIHTYKYNLWYNPLTQRLQRNIGQSGRFAGAAGVLEYDPDTGRWDRQLKPVAGSGGGALGGGVFVPGLPDGMLSVDNFTRYGQKDGSALLATAGGEVKTFTGLGQLPRPHDDHCFAWFYDPLRKRAMYYASPKDKPAQLFALDLSADKPKWAALPIRLAGEGKLPPGSREVVYIARHDVFIMLAGGRKGKPVEAWVIDAKSGRFAPLPLAGPTPTDADPAQGLQYDPVGDLCFYIHASQGVPVMQAFRYTP